MNNVNGFELRKYKIQIKENNTWFWITLTHGMQPGIAFTKDETRAFEFGTVVRSDREIITQINFLDKSSNNKIQEAVIYFENEMHIYLKNPHKSNLGIHEFILKTKNVI